MIKLRKWYPYLKYGLFVLLLIVLGVIIYLISIWYQGLQKENEVSYFDSELISKEEKQEEKSESSDENKKYILVDVKGAVANPSVYSIEDGKCVMDAINQAGLLDNSDTSMLNLSKRLYDEMVIIVYTKEEIENYLKVEEEKKLKQEYCQNENPTIKNDACITDKREDEKTLISLSKASLEELMMLPHIGEAKAKAIILYRSEHNGFQFVEQLLEIKGIGESIFGVCK